VTQPDNAIARRVSLRADVINAAEVVPVYWPISTFIAVNPLSGLERLPFEEALRRAGELYGARGTLSHEDFRSLHARGRIDTADLRAAVERLCPRVLSHPGVAVNGHRHDAATVLIVDLLHGPVDSAPARVPVLRSERDRRTIDMIDAQTSKWCSAFFGADHAAWPMPNHERGLYHSWRDLAWRDRALPRKVRKSLRGLATTPEEAIADALGTLGVGDDARVEYLRAHMTRMPGWAAHIRWRQEHRGDVDLVDYVAIRLGYEAALLSNDDRAVDLDQVRIDTPALPTLTERVSAVAAHLGSAASQNGSALKAITDVLTMLPVGRRRVVWQDAYEHHYRADLLSKLSTGTSAEPPSRPEAQLVCCIDTRSEELRRQFETVGNYQTFGFAGFFAVAIRYQQLGSAAASDQCPVLITPRASVTEQPAEQNARRVRRSDTGRLNAHAAEQAFTTTKADTLTPFALAESAGWAAGPIAAMRTLSPTHHDRLRDLAARLVGPEIATTVDISDFSAEEQHLFAEAALTMMGFTENFAPLVVLCGHGSTTENNPYAAALHCGACGGHRGGVNARTAAAILNEAHVRTHLRGRGIDIPPDTWFVAAEHDTSTDTVTLLDTHLIPDTPGLRRLTAALDEAGQRASLARAASLPGLTRHGPARRTVRRVRSRSTDWAQVYPEWGLAGNACFIVGPRELTLGIDLQRRAFLHSYDAATDPSGDGLETILTAPLIVAQWINHQYYFSSVDQEVFGAGTKTIHNVIGDIGVVAGHTGDLKLGLPWQSVAVGDELVHEPLRLLAVVQAPLDRIDTIVDRNPLLRNLIDNEWIALVARETHSEPWRLHTPTGWSISPYRKPRSA